MPDFLLTGRRVLVVVPWERESAELPKRAQSRGPEVIYPETFDFLINCTIIPQTDVPET